MSEFTMCVNDDQAIADMKNPRGRVKLYSSAGPMRAPFLYSRILN
jgi:hypothetical protein